MSEVVVKRSGYGVGRILSAAWLLAVLVLAAAVPAHADESAASAWFATDQGKVRLIAAAAATGAGAAAPREIALGLEFRLAPHWKIYWRSPGDAGFPPHLDWVGSENLADAQISWPAPQRFSVLGLETAGYTGTVVLPIAARLAHPGEKLSLHLALDYLTCSDICVPYDTVLTLDLPAGAAPAGSAAYAELIAGYQAQVPGDGKSTGLAVTGATLRPGKAAQLDLRLRSDRALVAPDAFVEGADGISFGAPAVQPGAGPQDAELVLPAHGDAAALAALAGKTLTVTVVDGARAAEAKVAPVLGVPVADAAAFASMLALALLGGLILNLMPCVLPVLSLKLLGIVAQGGRGPRAVRAGFLATAAGILLSFLAMAFALSALGAAGDAVGWGVQFQEPWFLVFLVAVLTLFAGNLWGFFEIAVPQRVAGLSLRFGGRGVLGNVATGAFATLLATPCSAPFLGTAVGFALASGPVEIVAVFLALGLGFAAPYLLVAAVPRLAALLPRPGRWMVELRRFLGVALALTAAWLLWVLAAEIGPDAALAVAALMAAVLAVLGVVQAPLLRRGVVAVFVLGALFVPALVPVLSPASTRDGIWRPFDPADIAAQVGRGRIVFVDVTADWCLTCKVNERLVLETEPVRDRLAASGVVAMRADWTRPDAAITDYLRRYGRYGIPFNAVYGPGAPDGIALPEILTPGRVTEALRQAAGGPGNQGRGGQG